MHPLKQQTAFLDTDAFDSGALMTEKGIVIVLFQLPKCIVLAVQSTMQTKTLCKSLPSCKVMKKKSVFLKIVPCSLSFIEDTSCLSDSKAVKYQSVPYALLIKMRKQSKNFLKKS